ncbi:MAG: ABC transporter ATP-binding protein [Candidatus Binatia bacterium]
MAFLEVQELTKSFEKDSAGLLVINRISLNVDEGEFVTVVGPSGCGKSTFLHILGGFIPRNDGTILLNKKEIEKPGPDRGMMFQDFALFPWRSVLGNVCWGLEVKNVSKEERLRTAFRYLDLVNLRAFKDHYPHELSGGMKQRVALARVLAFDPQILLMDEPFGSLDAQTREQMQEEITEIWTKTGKTVLFVTHDIEEAVYLSDRVFVFTARPAIIKEVVHITLPRPRPMEIKKSTEYAKLRNHIWDLIREEFIKSRRSISEH